MPSKPGNCDVKMKTVISILLGALLLNCSSYDDLTEERALRAQKGQGDIHIGVVWYEPFERTLFDEGVLMALDEINRSGGVLGRQLKLHMHPNVSGKQERQVARQLAQNPDVVAVIGHPLSGSAIQVSAIYQAAGVLFISTGATSPYLTIHGFSYVFRNLPSDAQTSKALVRYCIYKEFKKIAVIDDESEYGVTLANIFVEDAAKAGIEISIRKSYFPWQYIYHNMLHEVKEYCEDAVFLGGTLPQAAHVIKQARQMGIEVPFIGGDGLDEPLLMEIAGEAAEGTVVSTIFNPNDASEQTQQFLARFQDRYERMPDAWAALGYDAVYLLYDAFTQAKTTVPIIAASFLRFFQDRHSVAGTYSFSTNGDVLGKRFFYKAVHDRAFIYENNVTDMEEANQPCE